MRWFKAWGTTWRCGDMKIGKHGRSWRMWKRRVDASMAADGIQPQRGFQNVEHMHSSAQTAICVELSSVGCSGQQSENVQPRFLLKMWVSTLYSDYVKDYEDQIVRHISNVNATDFMMPSVCKQSKSLVSAYIPGDFLNMPTYWHSWNTTHRTRHVWRRENKPTSIVVYIVVSGIQTWPTDANGAPANCASGALRSWCRPLTPRIVRIHWNFRFFCNMARLLSNFVQGTRKVNQVGSLPKCRRWLAQPIVYIPNRVGSCRIVVKFFSFDPWPWVELHTIVLQIQWWFVHQCTRQRLLGLDIHWKQPANAKLEIIATSWLPSIATLRQLEMNKKGISPKLQGCPETILDTYVDFVDGICCKGSLRADQSFHQCHWLKRL